MSATSTTELYRERIWRIVHAIPRGQVTSYGTIAQLAGLPRGARLVGRVLGQLPAGSALPWHGVVNSRGRISFAPGSEHYRAQRERLCAEGIVFRAANTAAETIDMNTFGWKI